MDEKFRLLEFFRSGLPCTCIVCLEREYPALTGENINEVRATFDKEQLLKTEETGEVITNYYGQSY